MKNSIETMKKAYNLYAGFVNGNLDFEKLGDGTQVASIFFRLKDAKKKFEDVRKVKVIEL